MTSLSADPGAPVKVFVAADGNEFMKDIAGWIVEACRGRRATLHQDELPCADGSINLVVAPHEFFELYDAPRRALQAAASQSVCVSTEQPGTPWFELTVDACRRAQYVLDINHHGVDAMRARGIRARHLQLGAVESMIATDTTDDRPVDVLFMGGLDDRRGDVLAGLAAQLSPLRTELRLFAFDRPVNPTTPGLVFGIAKYELLASAKILLNVHRGAPAGAGKPAVPYFEWARMVEAMANRCVVVSEPSELYSPLRVGIDFVEAEVDQLGAAVEFALDDVRRRAIADSAHAMVTGELGLGRTLPNLLDELERDGAIGPSAPVSLPRATDRWMLGTSRAPQPVRLGPLQPVRDLQRRAKRAALADTALLRRIDESISVLRFGAPRHVDRSTTPAVTIGPAPVVSAIVTLYNYESVVESALASLVASEGIDMEIVVVDDHSTDDGRSVVTEFMERHPDVAITLLSKQANEGLAAARNDAFRAARGEFVFVMDADNQVRPPCLARLAGVLRADPGAAATYSILEDFGASRGLRSAFAWDVRRLCESNYIDAQAMWRRTAWEELGGYRADDEHVYGWEDWDLWLRLAATGGRAVLHREIQGRYRVQGSSMISLTNLETDDAIEAMRARHPTLPWPGSATIA